MELLCLCNDCYKLARRKDGYIFGYKYVNGKLRRYVKEELF